MPNKAPIRSPSSTRQRRYLLCGIRQLEFTMDPVDWIILHCATLAETFILLLGPLLICFASVIIGGLSWVFFTIYLPMLEFDLDQREASQLQRYIEIGGHVAFVIFVLVEILFNYFMCVTTRNAGKRSSYDKVVRELAESTNVNYPNTPQEVAQFQRDFSDKITIRLRRRRQREAEEQQRQLHSSCSDSNGDCSGSTSPRKTSTSSSNLASTSSGNDEENVTLRKNTRQQKPAKKQNDRGGGAPPSAPVRSWMLMGPDEWGFCSKTNQAKPPRSHYDNVSKTLVLCLDHYCPWMFNAIGYFNYRYFVNFLIFVFTAMMYGAMISYRPFMNSTGPLYREQLKEFRTKGVWTRIHPYVPISSERMPLSLGFMLCMAVGIAVGCLGGFHMWLVLTGQTTIEFHGNWVMKSRAKKVGQKYRNPYDMGYKRNFQQVYGDYSGKWGILMAIIIPSTREPEYLPLPMGGEEGKRKHMRKRIGKEETEMTEAFISAQPSTPATIV